MTEQHTRVQWPEGVDRTPADERTTMFGKNKTVQQVANDVLDELDLMGVDLGDVELQTNKEHLSNSPNVPALRGDPADPAAVLRFTVDGERCVVACDESREVRDNLLAIRDHLESVREAFDQGAEPEHFYDRVGLPDW